jgi:catechol 2,3-dioxygenase-like lactoylglutathione lyase family enzyme
MVAPRDPTLGGHVTVPSLAGHYHVGIVVDDIEAARARLRAMLGLTWGPVMRLGTAPYRDGDGNDIELPTAMCYSTGDPCLELIEEVPGSVWIRNESSNLHHIGFWADLDRSSAALSEVGCPLQLCGRAGNEAPMAFAYHRDDELGVRIELVDVALRDAMASFFQAAPEG